MTKRIKTWLARLEVRPVNTSEEIEATMQAEIDELRAQLAALQYDGELPQNTVHVMRRIRACESEVPAQVVLEHFVRQAIANYILKDKGNKI